MYNEVNNFIQESLIHDNLSLAWNYGSFRSSSLPICQSQLLLGKLTEAQQEKTVSFEKRYSYNIRRALKTTLHDFWANNLWGDWRCLDLKNCGILYNNTLLKDSLCIRCGSKSQYIEKTVHESTTGFSSQCDAIVFCDKLHGYLIFEINAKNSNILKNTSEPYPSEILKVSMSASLLKKTHNIPIAARVVLWFEKSKPLYKFWLYTGCGDDIVDKQLQLKIDLDTKVRQGSFSTIERVCKTVQDAEKRNCPFAHICFSPQRLKIIEELYTHA